MGFFFFPSTIYWVNVFFYSVDRWWKFQPKYQYFPKSKILFSFPRNASLYIYKSFIRPHLDYADTIYDKLNNASFKNEIENDQFRVCIAMPFKGRFWERPYHELGFESLTDRHWLFQKLVSFVKSQTVFHPISFVVI